MQPVNLMLAIYCLSFLCHYLLPALPLQAAMTVSLQLQQQLHSPFRFPCSPASSHHRIASASPMPLSLPPPAGSGDAGSSAVLRGLLAPLLAASLPLYSLSHSLVAADTSTAAQAGEPSQSLPLAAPSAWAPSASSSALLPSLPIAELRCLLQRLLAAVVRPKSVAAMRRW